MMEIWLFILAISPYFFNDYFKMTYKRYEYWSKEGKVWSDWFEWKSDYKPEYQMYDKRIFCRLLNEYREE